MSNKIEWDMKLAVVTDCLKEGLSFEEIARRHYISLGSVHNIMQEFTRGEWPGLDFPGDVITEVRDHTRRLHEAGMTVEREAVVLSVVEGWMEEGVEPGGLKGLYATVKGAARLDEEVGRIIEGAREVKTLEEEYGMSIKEILEQGRRSTDLANRENKILEQTKAKRIEEERQLEAVREERKVIVQIDDLKAQRDAHLAEEGEARERRRHALEEADITEEHLESHIAFRSAIEAAGARLTSSTMRRVVQLVQRRREPYLTQLMQLQDMVAARGWNPADAVSGLERLKALEAAGLNLERWEALVSAFSDYRIDAEGGIALIAEGVGRYGSFRRAVEVRDATVAQCELQIEEAESKVKAWLRLEGEAEERIQKKQLEAEEHYKKREQEEQEHQEKRQQVADDALNGALRRRQEVEEYAKKLAARNIELRGTVIGLNEQLKALKEEMSELTSQRDDVKKQLEAALGTKGEWEEIQNAISSAKEKAQQDLKDIEARINADHDILALAENLRRALGGDSASARSFFGYLALEPKIPLGKSEPVPNPEMAHRKLLATALELVKEAAISREEHERIKNQYEAEVSRLQNMSNEAARTIEGLKAQIEELRANLKDGERETSKLSFELHATRQRLQWSEEFRADLLAKQRK